MPSGSILWYSKATEYCRDKSTFSSAEFTAQWTFVELVVSLRYKLRMFSIPIEGPTNIFCDDYSRPSLFHAYYNLGFESYGPAGGGCPRRLLR
jgi:hypothetical protein